MEKTQQATNLLDRHNRLIADVLTRFRQLCMLATALHGDELQHSSIPAASVSSMAIQLEFDGLNTAIQDLLSLSRRLKELWVFGALGKQDAEARVQADVVDANVRRAAALLSQWQDRTLADIVQKHGVTFLNSQETQTSQTSEASGSELPSLQTQAPHNGQSTTSTSAQDPPQDGSDNSVDLVMT